MGHQNDIVVNQKELNITRRELAHDRNTVARGFLELGVGPGDIITVATGRSMYDNIVIFLAANRIGAIVAFLDEKTRKDQLLHYLNEFKSPLLITYMNTRAGLKSFKAAAPSLKNIINLDGTSTLGGFICNRTSIDQIAKKSKRRLPKNIFGGKREALISFTSGSTSGPKPMVFTNENLIAAALFSKAASGIKMWDKNIKTWFSFVKFDCPYGLWTSVMTPIIGGSSVILTPDINPTNFDYYFSKNPNAISGVPLLLDLLPRYLAKDINLSKVKLFISGGERLEASASEAGSAFFKTHGANIKICNGYGVGECLGSISVAVGSSYRPDTVGRVVPGCHVMVLDPETGKELSHGKTGMLYVSGKHTLSRYYNRPDLDEQKLITIKHRRFVKTGDLATISETGFITLVGRATFFINSVPAKVYYEIVRSAVAKSPVVSKCYVVKMPDKKMGYTACAFVVTKDGVPQNDDTRDAILAAASEPFYIGAHCIELKNYELPEKIVFLDALPLTPANKTDFRALERTAAELATAKRVMVPKKKIAA
ncbi:acyl--CoA ligase [Candidatus Saccharibacteria bacterium]|nr:acyl--CoA ligase [Candidatus Saccharibacteria bacterium]